MKKQDLKIIDSLFFAAVKTYNQNLDEKFRDAWSITMPELYYRQYIPYIKNGYTFIWVNCFCGDNKHYPYWRREKVSVDDGGKCFFNFSINLDTRKFSEFHTNGLG